MLERVKAGAIGFGVAAGCGAEGVGRGAAGVWGTCLPVRAGAVRAEFGAWRGEADGGGGRVF